MKTKETSYKNVLKSNVVLFLTYGILTGFIFILITIIVKCTLHNIHNTFLSVTLSLISGILIFYLSHFVCKSSTLESFRKIKLSEENTKPFLQKMNLLFLICIILSILFCIGYLFIYNQLFLNAIAEAYEKYEFISSDFANQVVQKITEEYHQSLGGQIASTIIIELSLVVSFFSLIPYEKKMLEKYNKSTD